MIHNKKRNSHKSRTKQINRDREFKMNRKNKKRKIFNYSLKKKKNEPKH